MVGNINRKKSLKPYIFRYLDDKGNTNFDLLVRHINEETGVSLEKIKFRIEKLSSKGEVLIRNGIVSRIISSKTSKDQAFDENKEFGPITLARKGNIVSVKSEMGKTNTEGIQIKAKKELPIIRENVQRGIENIEKLILEDYDPLDVLAYVSAKNMLINPETDTESSFEGKQLFPEIVQNIVLRNDLEKYTGSNRHDIGRFFELTKNLGEQLSSYLFAEALARDDLTPSEGDVYFHILSSFLWVRGDAYPQHYKEIALELFSKINVLLETKGYNIEEYWKTVDEIDRQIRYNFSEPIKKLTAEHEKFVEFATNESMKGTKPSEIKQKYQQEAAERIKALQPDLKKLSEIALKGSFEIEINREINQRLLNLLSMNFGENSQWTNPFDKSDIFIKPIIKTREKYYCFLTPHLTRNVIAIIESQLTQDDKERVDYSEIKGSYFEEKAIQLLNRMIMGKAYRGLVYPKDNEVDGIIVFEEIVFLIEVKGKKKRIIAGAADMLKLTKDDLKAHIVDAFNQTKKVYDYIQSKDEVDFKDKNGIVTLKLRKDNIKRFYRVIVCLENFSKLAIDINLIKTWIPDLMKVDEYPWTVNIYDLRIISDLIEKDRGAFVTYLDERLKVAETSILEGVDEIDFLGYFFEHGNLDRLKNLGPANSTLIVGFSEGIDRWYSYLRGEVSKAEKPALKKSNNHGHND